MYDNSCAFNLLLGTKLISMPRGRKKHLETHAVAKGNRKTTCPSMSHLPVLGKSKRSVSESAHLSPLPPPSLTPSSLQLRKQENIVLLHKKPTKETGKKMCIQIHRSVVKGDVWQIRTKEKQLMCLKRREKEGRKGKSLRA